MQKAYDAQRGATDAENSSKPTTRPDPFEWVRAGYVVYLQYWLLEEESRKAPEDQTWLVRHIVEGTPRRVRIRRAPIGHENEESLIVHQASQGGRRTLGCFYDGLWVTEEDPANLSGDQHRRCNSVVLPDFAVHEAVIFEQTICEMLGEPRITVAPAPTAVVLGPGVLLGRYLLVSRLREEHHNGFWLARSALGGAPVVLVVARRETAPIDEWLSWSLKDGGEDELWRWGVASGSPLPAGAPWPRVNDDQLRQCAEFTLTAEVRRQAAASYERPKPSVSPE